MWAGIGGMPRVTELSGRAEYLCSGSTFVCEGVVLLEGFSKFPLQRLLVGGAPELDAVQGPVKGPVVLDGAVRERGQKKGDNPRVGVISGCKQWVWKAINKEGPLLQEVDRKCAKLSTFVWGLGNLT